MSLSTRGVTALAAVAEPVASPVGFVRRRWHLIGPERHPVAAELLARSAGMRAACATWPPHPAGTAVLVGSAFHWRDNAMLLDGIAAARRDGGRLVLLHLGGGGGSLLRVAAKEHPSLETLAIELPPDPPPRAVRVAVALANHAGEYGGELRVDAAGRVSRAAWKAVELPQPTAPPRASAPESVLVTGGLGGLGIRVAGVLAASCGLHPVLVDAASPAELPADAAAHLTRLLGGAAGATVVTADLTDPQRLATALGTTGAPPVRAVVHCAGLLHGRQLDGFTSHDLSLAQLAKVDGLRNVLAAVDPLRLRHLITFGSITAEIPHRSMASYALANELLRRETLRAAPGLPRCATVAGQWSLWSGAGMAHRAGAVGQARRMGMTPVSLRAGMSALLRLLCWPSGPERATALILRGEDLR